MATTESWVQLCKCCCGDEQVHFESSEDKMRCVTCSCSSYRPKEDASMPITVRLMLRGKISLKMMDQASVLARLLGADDDSSLKKISSQDHYIDVPADGIISRLEIANLTNSVKR